MQKTFLKNVVGISSAAFLWVTLGSGLAAEPASEGKKPSSASTGVNAADTFNPLETPEARIVEEWEKMGIIPDIHADPSPNSPDLNANSLPPEDKGVDLPVPAPQAVEAEALSDVALSTPFEGESAGIALQPVKMVVKFDNDEGPKIPADPTDPTAPGDRSGGQHKGTPKVAAQLASIPIIRMGGNFQGQGGFKVIHP